MELIKDERIHDSFFSKKYYEIFYKAAVTKDPEANFNKQKSAAAYELEKQAEKKLRSLVHRAHTIDIKKDDSAHMVVEESSESSEFLSDSDDDIEQTP